MRRIRNYSPLSFHYRFNDREEGSEYHKDEYQIRYKIDPKTGRMISDQRFIRLGKAKLFDSLSNRYMEDEREQILLYDTQEQILYCFDIKDLLEDYVLESEEYIVTRYNTFSLSSLTKNIAMQNNI